MFAQKTCHYVKVTRVPNDVSKTSNSAFSVNVQFVYRRLYLFWKLVNCSRLRDELTWYRRSITCPGCWLGYYTITVCSFLLWMLCARCLCGR